MKAFSMDLETKRVYIFIQHYMLLFIKESEGVFYAVRTGSLDVIQISEGFKGAFNYFRSVDIE